MQLQPLFTTPSQSSSRLLAQFSCIAVPAVQRVGAALVQAFTVTWQAPMPHDTVPSASSAAPLQSSSSPLHDSTEGPTAPMHGPVPPSMHCEVPDRQEPVPGVPLANG